jgi:hypothetical protein
VQNDCRGKIVGCGKSIQYIRGKVNAVDREQQTPTQLVEHGGVDCHHSFYTAPEIMFGDVGFGLPVDSWSLGVVLAECAGNPFCKPASPGGAFVTCKGVLETRKEFCRVAFRQLGTPSTDALRMLPLYPAKQRKVNRMAWPECMRTALGVQGIVFVEALLEWEPSKRARLGSEVLEHSYLKPERFCLGGWTRSSPSGGFVPAAASPSGGFVPAANSQSRGFVPAAAASFEGRRHRWNVLQGEMSAEVLCFLQADPALMPSTDEHAALELGFTAKRKDARSEEGRKCIIAGHLGWYGTSSNSGLMLDQPLPLRRTQAWFLAWKRANAAPLAVMLATCRRRLCRMSKEMQGKNGIHFLETDMDEWCLTSAEMSVSRAGSGDDLWSEPEHMDGGASVLHMGMTLFGRRHIRCVQGEGLPEVFVPCRPGSVYMGQFTGPLHQEHTRMYLAMLTVSQTIYSTAQYIAGSRCCYYCC